MYRGVACYVGGPIDTSGHLFVVSNHKVFYDVAFSLEFGAFFGMSKKSLFCEKRMCVFIINGPNRWDSIYKWTYALAHTNTQEHDVAPSIRAL